MDSPHDLTRDQVYMLERLSGETSDVTPDELPAELTDSWHYIRGIGKWVDGSPLNRARTGWKARHVGKD